MSGFGSHLLHEWVILINLLLLLLGFALLAKLFEDTEIPAVLPRWLPDDWKGCFVLLVLVFVLSSFLDNIAAAMIGGAIAHTVFSGKVHVGFLAAIVAASNGGGSGSVVGDTTTTMMWIAGIDPLEVLEAFIGSGIALVLFGIPACCSSNGFSPIQKDEGAAPAVDWVRVAIVAFILVSAIVVNVVVNIRFNEVSDLFPFLGAAVWGASADAPLRRPDWSLLPGALQGLSVPAVAGAVRIDDAGGELPAASWPHGARASASCRRCSTTSRSPRWRIKQGGYDWGFLAYAVGFGGSMIWFGSSAGVALCGMYPQGRNVGQWLRHGWHVASAT